jgi:crotonobetainyl-CoA:carnitine CoA-transferase CaiB-like acyl-CoA transferase
MGFGYERLKEINPRLIYAQQSGMGYHGTHSDIRTYGPVAAGFAGLSEMSGLPSPYPPAGIGYSYLDWFGAYNIVNAILAALHRRTVTGEGCWLDLSQTEIGLYLTGTATLDWSANGRRWSRFGNRSPYKSAAPHGAYRAAGDDRWVAIACFTEDDWHALTTVLQHPEWKDDPRFADVTSRCEHADELDAIVDEVTRDWEPYELMDSLQGAGVPAGVCQDARDRCEIDPQLAHLEWLVDLPQTEIGTWPAKDLPVRMSRSNSRVGGPAGRHGPNYGEDNEDVYGGLLGLSQNEIAELSKAGVI